MNAQVLLLDQTYEPLRVIGWMRAMTLVISGKAEVVEESDLEVRSPSQSFSLPSVIRQLCKFKRKKDIPFTKMNIFMRDGWKCQYCAKRTPVEELTFDHVVPKSAGGKTNWENIVAACRPCNMKKSNRTPEQAGMRLLKKPDKPRWSPQIVLRMRKLPENWKPYLDAVSFAYWNTELQP